MLRLCELLSVVCLACLAPMTLLILTGDIDSTDAMFVGLITLAVLGAAYNSWSERRGA